MKPMALVDALLVPQLNQDVRELVLARDPHATSCDWR
jgi:hypothetical protein